ncbi:hypothetical protein EVAR_27749_1 [Eumeta japonica]|uniref:Uncharacterized protein n=1 Tax=Eumeta variegata TaxID=151549 RepID=A0A4C1VB50_EUMVA|nr:hypothetical protein EVAR_27749_1 [Eumeta japonica]
MAEQITMRHSLGNRRAYCVKVRVSSEWLNRPLRDFHWEIEELTELYFIFKITFGFVEIGTEIERGVETRMGTGPGSGSKAKVEPKLRTGLGSKTIVGPD